MTRLISEWLDKTDKQIMRWGKRIIEQTGDDAFSLACRAAALISGNDIDVLALRETCSQTHVAVITITADKGEISGFAASIGATVAHLGAEVMLPDETDVSGIYSACSSEADILFMADEQKYIALSLHGGVVAENDMATAYGYACALDAMADGIEDKDVLVIGLGRVGMFATKALTQLGANISVYDKDKSKYAGIKKNTKIKIAEKSDVENAELIFDATNIGAWLDQSQIREDALISAPGIPSSIIGKQDAKLRDRVFHDPLQTGTAVMLAWALAEESY